MIDKEYMIVLIGSWFRHLSARKNCTPAKCITCPAHGSWRDIPARMRL